MFSVFSMFSHSGWQDGTIRRVLQTMPLRNIHGIYETQTSTLPKSYRGPNICRPAGARAKNGQNSENFVNSEWHLSEGWNQKLTDAMGTGYWPKPNFHRNICCVKDVSYIFNISASKPSLSTKRVGYFSFLVFNLAERWEREAIWQILPGADTCPSARMTLLMCDLSRCTWTKRQAGSANVCFSGVGRRRGGATRPRLSRRHLLAVEQLVEPTLKMTITYVERDVLACNW